jgi:hypothetical protein
VWCDGTPAAVTPHARHECISIYSDPAAESSNQRRVRGAGSPRHRPPWPPIRRRIYGKTTVATTVRACRAMVDQWRSRHVRATIMYLYIYSTPPPRARINAGWRPCGSPSHRPPRPPTGRIYDEAAVTVTARAYGTLVYQRRSRQMRVNNVFLYIHTPPWRDRINAEYEAPAPTETSSAMATPYGAVIMARPPSPQRYGRGVRW